MLNGHGDDGYLYKDKLVANFSSNVYYPGFTEGLKQHIASSLDKVRNYPEADGASLATALSRLHQVDASQVVVTNGATEAFYLIANTFHGSTATIVVPTFAEYEDSCNANKVQLTFLPWEELEEEAAFRTRLAFICNPNNPTGTVIQGNILETLLSRNPGTIFIIDEAYIDFTRAINTVAGLTGEYKNLVVVRSLTKAFAIPGLRLGYLLGNTELCQTFSAQKMPWSVNALAMEAGKYILDHYENMKLPLQQILENAAWLREQLNAIPGIKAYPSHTSFFLCETEKATAAELKEYLIKQWGILIRDASNFRNLTPQHFRIASQSREENELLIKALKAWTSTS